MASECPDVARSAPGTGTAALDWVGMEGIHLPLELSETGGDPRTHATASIGVDLPGGDETVKGIHMSRLYRHLNQLTEAPLTAAGIKALLEAALHSHKDCASRSAALSLTFPFMLYRPALVTDSGGGWHRYPVRIDGHLHRDDATPSLRLGIDVCYSSTCPCSAALSRQALASAFRDAFGDNQTISPETVTAWLERAGTLATPHSQRSTARVGIALEPSANALGLVELVDRIENALGTPVQTLVKRSDEQAFARRNGANLMYVEDASRILADALTPHYRGLQIRVAHHESLHAHNAVAEAAPPDEANASD